MDTSLNSELVNTYETLSGQDLLKQLSQRAPLSSDNEEKLIEKGWKAFFSYREYEPNGKADTEQLRLALEALDNEVSPLLRSDYDFCRARSGVITNPVERDRIRALLIKKTAERIKWEKNQAGS